MTLWRDPEEPYPMRINHAVKCEDITIISWMDEEIRLSVMGGMDFFAEKWEAVYSNRTELKNSSSLLIPHKSQSWLHSLDAEVLALASQGNKFAFISMNRGVYYLECNSNGIEEIWRTEIPDWPKPWPGVIWRLRDKENGNLDTYPQSIHLNDENLILFDERSSWVILSLEDGRRISGGRLPFSGKNTGTWRGENSWAIIEDNRNLHLLDADFNIISTHKTPGPVNHARESVHGWIWTGWRHNGTENGIKAIKEIGVWIDTSDKPRVLSNDGRWSEFTF